MNFKESRKCKYSCPHRSYKWLGSLVMVNENRHGDLWIKVSASQLAVEITPHRMESSLPSYSSSNVKYVVNVVNEKISTLLFLILNKNRQVFFFLITQHNILSPLTLSEVAIGEGAKALFKVDKEHYNDRLVIFFSHHWIFRCLFIILYYWIHLVVFISP